MDIENTFNQLFASFDLCGTTNVITSLQITLIMTFPCVMETERRAFLEYNSSSFSCPILCNVETNYHVSKNMKNSFTDTVITENTWL